MNLAVAILAKRLDIYAAILHCFEMEKLLDNPYLTLW